MLWDRLPVQPLLTMNTVDALFIEESILLAEDAMAAFWFNLSGGVHMCMDDKPIGRVSGTPQSST